MILLRGFRTEMNEKNRYWAMQPNIGFIERAIIQLTSYWEHNLNILCVLLHFQESLLA